MDAGQHSSFFNQVFCVPTLGRFREPGRRLEASAQAAIAPDKLANEPAGSDALGQQWR